MYFLNYLKSIPLRLLLLFVSLLIITVAAPIAMLMVIYYCLIGDIPSNH